MDIRYEYLNEDKIRNNVRFQNRTWTGNKSQHRICRQPQPWLQPPQPPPLQMTWRQPTAPVRTVEQIPARNVVDVSPFSTAVVTVKSRTGRSTRRRVSPPGASVRDAGKQSVLGPISAASLIPIIYKRVKALRSVQTEVRGVFTVVPVNLATKELYPARATGQTSTCNLYRSLGARNGALRVPTR